MKTNDKKVELPEWYDCIEDPLKELVYLLRNNGFNTESSCGHKMYIQCGFATGNERLSTLERIVNNYLSSNNFRCVYDITATVMHRAYGPARNYIMIDFINIGRAVKSPHSEQKFALRGKQLTP